MTIEHHRTIEPRLRPRRFAAFVAPLAAAVLLGAPPAAAEPTVKLSRIAAHPGVEFSLPADAVFADAGTNPEFTEAEFSTTEYYDRSGIDADGVLWVQAKAVKDLNDLPSPPTSPFEVTAAVTMTNDEGQTASATLTFITRYSREASAPPPPSVRTWQTGASPSRPQNAPAGTLISTSVEEFFDNPGTNPRFIDAEFSTTEYYDVARVSAYDPAEPTSGRILVKAKLPKDLKALPTPPPNPFTVTAVATMTNDEGQKAQVTITYKTSWDNR